MLSLEPRGADGRAIDEPWRAIAARGPDAVGYVFANLPRELARNTNTANRMIRPPGAERGQLRSWILRELSSADNTVLESHGINSAAWEALLEGDARAFIQARQSFLVEREHQFQEAVGVRPSDIAVGSSPVDTD